MKNSAMTTTRFFSAAVSLPNSRTDPKKATASVTITVPAALASCITSRCTAPAARVALVELAHQTTDIGLEHARAQRDHQQADVEQLDARRHRQQQIAQRDQHPAPEYRAAQPEQPVGDPAARQ